MPGPPWRCCCFCRRRFSASTFLGTFTQNGRPRNDTWRDFPAYAATQRLNKILGRDDGVLCTGCSKRIYGRRPAVRFRVLVESVYHISDPGRSPRFAAVTASVTGWSIFFPVRPLAAQRDRRRVLGRRAVGDGVGTVAVYDVAAASRLTASGARLAYVSKTKATGRHSLQTGSTAQPPQAWQEGPDRDGRSMDWHRLQMEVRGSAA